MTSTAELIDAPAVTTPAIENQLSQISAEVAALKLIETVFAGIEQRQLHTAPNDYLTANLDKKSAELKNLLGESAPNQTRIRQAEMRLRQEFGLWRTALAKRDEEFTAFDLRTFCGNVEPELDRAAFAALAGLYRNMPPTNVVLSKFDFAITQYFCIRRENNCRALRCEAGKIIAELRRLNSEWTNGAANPPRTVEQIRAAITSLAKNSARAKTHQTLKSWLENDFFDVTRTTKRNLSEAFFVPEVTAAVIVGNLVVGNHFAALCQADNAKLTEAAQGVFATDESSRQIIANQLNQAFQTLIDSGLEEDYAETIAQERLSNLINLVSEDQTLQAEVVSAQTSATIAENQSEIENAQEIDETNETNVPISAAVQTEHETIKNAQENSAENPAENLTENALENSADQILEAEIISESIESVDKNETVETVEVDESTAAIEDAEAVSELLEIESLLTELAKSQPNTDNLKAYLQQSATPEIRDLRITAFLPENEKVSEESRTLRSVLNLILRAEEMTRSVKTEEGNIPQEFQNKVGFLHEEIQLFNNRLRRSMRESSSDEAKTDEQNEVFDNLLYATNTLVETQLRLNSAIVRRQNREEERLAAEAAAHDATQFAEPVEKIMLADASVSYKLPKQTARRKFSRGILALAAFAVLAFGGFFVYESMLGETQVKKGNFQTLEPAQLKGGTNLVATKINKETLFAITGKDWDALNAEQKKVNLKMMLDDGGKFGFRTVLLMSKDGRIVGKATEESIEVS